MNLEQFYVFPIDAPLSSAKRRAIEAQIDDNAELFERKVSYKWLKRGEERFLRIVVGPVTIEVVFFDDRVECYGAAPTWARLLFTKSRKEDMKARLEKVLVGAGLVMSRAA